MGSGQRNVETEHLNKKLFDREVVKSRQPQRSSKGGQGSRRSNGGQGGPIQKGISNFQLKDCSISSEDDDNGNGDNGDNVEGGFLCRRRRIWRIWRIFSGDLVQRRRD